MMEQTEPKQPAENNSPSWTSNTKLVVAIAFMAVTAWVFNRFQNLIGLLLMAVVISYLLNPVAVWLRQKIKISWGLTVGLLYLLFLIVLGGLLTWGGIALVDQISSLIKFLQGILSDAPGFFEDLTTKPVQIGPIVLNLSTLGIENLGDQLLGLAQPALSSVGSLVGSVAGGAVSAIGWIFFIILVSYFILLESKGMWGRVQRIRIPGYSYDQRRIAQELSRIWNSFLRGQLIVVLIAIIIYTILLASLGVRYFYVLALIAGIARFVPYIGAWVTWITYGLVSFFQGTNIFGMEQVFFMLMILGISIVVDTLIDNLINTRIMADTLRVHPAVIMVAVILGASIFGFIGVLLATPVMATIQLIVMYAIRKLFDLDPWEGISTKHPEPSLARIFPWIKKVGQVFRNLWSKIQKKGLKTDERPK